MSVGISRNARGKASVTHARNSGKQRKIDGRPPPLQVVRGLPKLSLAVDSGCHLILAARATTGSGADQLFFEPLLFDALRRTGVKSVVADAGYDSEANHCIARQDMGIRSIIPPNSGPSPNPPTARHRRNMYYRFKRKADSKFYGQRWQAETVNSMIKRNMGSALRATTAGDDPRNCC